MSEDPLYGPNANAPTEDDELSYPLGGSDAVIQAQLDQLAKQAHHDEHDKAERRSQKRAPKDRMLRMPRRDR